MSGSGSMGEATVAIGNSAVAVDSAPLVAATEVATVAAATANATPAEDNSLPCAQGRVGEGCAPLAAGSSQLSTQAASDAEAKAAVGTNLTATAKTHTATIAHPSRPQTFAKQAEGPGVGGAVFALILVVSLILALGWLAKRMPGFGRASGGGNALRIVGSLTLGPRDRVVVVDVGGTQLLLGVGQNGMTTLHTLTEPLPVAQPSQGTPSLQNLATPFAQLLQKHLGKKP